MQTGQNVFNYIRETTNNKALLTIADKVIAGKRIDFNEGVALYENASLGFAGTLADYIRRQRHGSITYFNRNFHIEPTNLCVFSCKFCSYSRLIKQKEDGWVLSKEQMLDIVRSYKDKPVTEVHIVGGVLPQMSLYFFAELLKEIKAIAPKLHIKGYTAVELEYMIRKAKMSWHDGLKFLQESGLDSLPGGGAEIFDEEVRNIICADKCNSETWLEIHETAHNLGMHTNATILYGHIEKYHHRIDHMEKLRRLQDKTHGFNTFIPLKFRNKNNEMSHIPEVSVVEDLRNYAISRIYLDNFPHVKAYWPMIGRQVAQLSLDFGVNDIDGTIDDSTKIYSMAGAEEQSPTMTTREIVNLIKEAGKHPVERDTLYNALRDYNDVTWENEPEDVFVNLPVIH